MESDLCDGEDDDEHNSSVLKKLLNRYVKQDDLFDEAALFDGV